MIAFYRLIGCTPEDWEREEAEFQKRLGDRLITPLPEGQFVIVKERLNV